MNRHSLFRARVSLNRLLCAAGMLLLAAPGAFADAVPLHDGEVVSLTQDPLTQGGQDEQQSGSKCTPLMSRFRVGGVPLWFKLSLGAVPAVTILGLTKTHIRIIDRGPAVIVTTGDLPTPTPPPTPVPEPATIALLGAGLAGAVVKARRRRKA